MRKRGVKERAKRKTGKEIYKESCLGNISEARNAAAKMKIHSG
jgi:hypothetical protein